MNTCAEVSIVPALYRESLSSGFPPAFGSNVIDGFAHLLDLSCSVAGDTLAGDEHV